MWWSSSNNWPFYSGVINDKEPNMGAKAASSYCLSLSGQIIGLKLGSRMNQEGLQSRV